LKIIVDITFPPHSRGGIKGGVENKILKNSALATDEINICVKVKY